MDHDRPYKKIFSHPELVTDLIRNFVDEPWVEQLDFTTLERQSGSYVSDELRERHDDVIWRVRFQDRWLYLYLLLELQSTVDRFMAVRLLVYVGLLYQDLIKQRKLTVHNQLPPVLPLVLYNGNKLWSAETNIQSLIASIPLGLEHYQADTGHEPANGGKNHAR